MLKAETPRVAIRCRNVVCGWLAWFVSASAMAATAGDFPSLHGSRASDFETDRPSAIEIPEADARPTSPVSGPFFGISDVRIVGLDDDPERRVDVAALHAQAMAAIARQAAEQEIAEQGFSNEELREVARFLERVRGRGDATTVTKIALMDELIDLVDELDGRRGISVFDLELVARELQDEIRATGMLLAQVVVPPQTIRDGVVEMQVYPGLLGQVEVVNNRIYKSPALAAAFRESIGQTVQVDDIEERLRRVNDLGGMDISGVFVPGRNQGETLLELNVINERRWNATSRVDNHGSDITGRTRGLVALDLFDPTGAGDQLSLQALRSEGPNGVTLGALRYRRPLGGLRHFVEAGLSRNEFTIGGVIDVQGETTNYEAVFGTQLQRTRERNLTRTFHLGYKDTVLEVGPLDQNQEIIEAGGALSYDMLISDWTMVVDGASGFRAGTIRSGRFEGGPRIEGGTFPGQDKNFFALTQDARVYKLFSVNLPYTDITSRHSLLFRFRSQYTNQFLPSVERFSLGGADGVRNLLADDISVDKGAVANLQLYWEIPSALDFSMPWARQRFSEFLRPYVFYDYAYGVTNAQRVSAQSLNDTWFEFRGYGIGAEYNLFKSPRGNFLMRGSINVAWPENLRFGDPVFRDLIDDERRIYADFTLDFDLNTFRRQQREP